MKRGGVMQYKSHSTLTKMCHSSSQSYTVPSAIMKTAIVLLVALSAVLADVSHLKSNQIPKADRYTSGAVPPAPHHHSGQQYAIVRQEQDVNFDGNYQFAYETENGIKAEERGSVKQLGPEELAQQAQGSYSYQSPEGENVQVSYVADENGFQVQGSHLPVPPPIPEAILRAIEYIRAHPPSETANRF